MDYLHYIGSWFLFHNLWNSPFLIQMFLSHTITCLKNIMMQTTDSSCHINNITYAPLVDYFYV